jgi:hypothetical protein
MRYLALLLLFGCASTIPSQFDSPIVAYPLDEKILEDADVTAAFDALLARAAYGLRNDERAGFLILDASGRFHLEDWPATGRYRAEHWEGPIPVGTVAVVHTHPAGDPFASPHDCLEAERIGIPIFVLTPRSVVLVTDDGRARYLFRAGMTTMGGRVAYTDRR